MVYKLICLVLASSLPFMFTLHGDFVFDDSEAIIKNKDVVSESWMDAFNNDFWGTDIKSNLSHKSYRPLTIISFRINYWLNNNQLSAVHFKVTNLISHTLCCLIVYNSFIVILNDVGFEKSITSCIDIAYTAATLFAVHPVHVEAVSGIVGRADILACCTFFLAFIFYSKSMRNCKFMISYFYVSTAILLAGISMLFKENGITVLGFCIIYDIVITKNIKTKQLTKGHLNFNIKVIIRLSLTSLGIIVLLYGRWTVMGRHTPAFKAIDNPAAFSDNLFTKLATYNYIYFLNALLVIWPQWLCYDWSMGCVPLIHSTLDFRILCIWAIYLYGVLVVRVIIQNSWNISTKRLLIVTVSLTIIPFLPAANILYTVGFVIAERVLYIPSAGYCLLFAIGFKKILTSEKRQRYKLYILLFSLLIITYGVKSWKRSIDWQNEYRLYISGMAVCPLNAKVRYNVAKVADASHNTEWAMEEYKAAIRLNPNYYQAMNNIANLLKNQKQYTEAEDYLKSAVRLKRDFPAAWMNLGIVLANVRRYDEALDAYKTAMEYRKKYPDCLYNLGNLYLEMNMTKDAMESWFQAINLNSSHVLAWTNLLALLDNSGHLEKAQEVIPVVLNELPDSPSINFAVANIYGKLERYKEAEKHFRKAIKLFGNRVQAIHFANLGVLYHRWKKYDLAENMYKNALKINPNFKSAERNLRSVKKMRKQ
ncbi:transmembrane and TPR repeat-containing protein 4-like [Hyposmocoma kahamanoa]|uniref:transmembrane and TPR repeat-containing protein 4-like n=1 Tax=Hyposmocoma kahamanoa TaxID=1477025 RepID=UPI000E6D71E5|nr:transmembrane and TPR repeat-containing protein 4-like [Hyposmocoma kahamanoa]